MSEICDLIHIDDFCASERSDSELLIVLANNPQLSLSMLVKAENLNYIKDSVLNQLSNSSNPIYVHLNFLEGSAISGQFKFKSIWYWLTASFFPRISSKGYQNSILSEACHQIEFITNLFGASRILGIDSHMHVHLYPSFRSNLTEICARYPHLRIRTVSEKISTPDLRVLLYLNYYLNVVKWALLMYWSKKVEKNLNLHSIKFSRFAGVLYSGFQSRNSIIKAAKLSGNRIIVHPNFDPNFPLSEGKRFAKFYRSFNRRSELEVIIDKLYN